MAKHIPDLYFEQELLGELPGKHREKVKNAPRYKETLKKLRDSNEEILKRYPPENFARNLKALTEEKEREQKEKSRRRFVFSIGVPAAAAACLLIAFTAFPSLFVSGSNQDSSIKEITRIKGLKPVLHVYRENNEEPEMLKDEAVIHQNDLLQLTYIAGSKKYGTIFSIDGRGSVTLHYPEYETLPPVLEESGEIALPYSYELDDAPGFEQFFFITSDSEFSVSDILNSARQITVKNNQKKSLTLDIPKKYEQTTIFLKKGEIK